MSVFLVLTFLIVRCPCPIIAFHPLGNWVSIGPVEIIESIYDPPNSGRATVIAVNPLNPNDVWLGTATGGLWYSNNINSIDYQWISQTDFAPSLSIGSILLENCSAELCSTIWVGTGENNIRRDTYYGTGLLKISWDANINDYKMSLLGYTEEHFKYGSIIDIKRFDGSLYVAVSKGKSASASTTIITAPEPRDGYGIYRSNDEGLTWEKVGTNPNGALPSDMEIQNASLLVGFHGQGIFRLTAGDIWCPLGPVTSVPPTCSNGSSTLPNPIDIDFDHVEIAISPSNPNVIYAAYGRCESETFQCSVNPLFFVSQDGGVLWQPGYNNEDIRTYSRYTHVLKVHPYFEDWVYYGGLKLWLSTNYGNNFSIDGAADEIHLDMQDLVYPDPSHPSILYAASDGGFYLVNESFPQNAIPLNHGLETVQFYSVSSSTWEGSPLVMGGTQDNGTVIFNGSPIWEFVLESDGGDCIIASEDLFYATMIDISPHKASGNDIHLGDFVEFDEGIVSSDPSLYTPPFLMHPLTHALYFGTNRLYMRGEADDNWIPISPYFDSSTNIYPEIERRNAISSISLSRSNPNTIYLALYNGDFWVSNSEGPCPTFNCWTKIGGEGIDNSLPISIPTSIDIDPEDENIAYATFSNFNDVPNIWRTKDRGESWEPFSEGLPNNLPIKVVRVKPDQRNVIYIGTDNGVYRRNQKGTLEIFCLRFGTSWYPYGPELGLPNVPVYDIDFDPANNLIYAATHGRGMYMLTDEPVIYTYIVFGGGKLQGIYLFGHAFHYSYNSPCFISYLTKDGKYIASTNVDSRGGTISVNEVGRLVSINKDRFHTTTMVIPCMERDCIKGIKSGISIIDEDLAQVEVSAGKYKVKTDIKFHPSISCNPSSTLFKVRKLSNESNGKVYLKAIAVNDTVSQISKKAALASAEIIKQDTDLAILERLAKNFNKAQNKEDTGYWASVFLGKKEEKIGEDVPDIKPFITLKNEKIKAMQIFIGFRADPGEANGLAFDLESIGLFVKGELIQVQIIFSTYFEGASGGEITLVQRTPVGICRVSIETEQGQSAEQIARNLFNAYMNLPFPENRQCESRYNSYDLKLLNNSIITSSALGISVEVKDHGIGVSVVPF
ncbi:MAG: WD40/YVTN/BNR-like repeat-containing protein [Candidatus Thorarchaeota archaeon]